jgi:hypothetical protein
MPGCVDVINQSDFALRDTSHAVPCQHNDTEPFGVSTDSFGDFDRVGDCGAR